jgi:predicted DNA-binding transcriptional regulator AlpA
MSDHTIHVETLPDFTRDADAVERFEEAMASDRVADGTACMLDVASGSLSATFHVHARSLAHAIELGVKAFDRGLSAAGFDVNRPGWRLLIDAREGGDPLDPVPRRYELEKLLTGAEVAERLGVSRRRLGQLTDSGDFPVSRGKVGDTVVWLRSDIDAWEGLRRHHREDTLRRLEKLGSQDIDGGLG